MAASGRHPTVAFRFTPEAAIAAIIATDIILARLRSTWGNYVSEAYKSSALHRPHHINFDGAPRRPDLDILDRGWSLTVHCDIGASNGSSSKLSD